MILMLDVVTNDDELSQATKENPQPGHNEMECLQVIIFNDLIWEQIVKPLSETGIWDEIWVIKRTRPTPVCLSENKNQIMIIICFDFEWLYFEIIFLFPFLFFLFCCTSCANTASYYNFKSLARHKSHRMTQIDFRWILMTWSGIKWCKMTYMT